MNITTVIAKLSPATIYRIFKYLIYCLLASNIVLFFHEEYLDSIEFYDAWFPGWNTSDAYSATIDTFAWVVLLLLFELETAVISDEKLKGNLKWILMSIRSISYLIILYAFYGYCAQYGIITNFVPFQIEDVCSLLGSDYDYIQVDNYAALTPEVCDAMRGQELVRMEGTQIISTVAAMESAIYLSIVDIVNAGDWLVIVFLLELEVYLQLKNRLTDKLILIFKFVKSLFYFILFACAIYWGFEGELLDFWDAFLWLLAFIFIEMNLFQWQADKEDQENTVT